MELGGWNSSRDIKCPNRGSTIAFAFLVTIGGKSQTCLKNFDESSGLAPGECASALADDYIGIGGGIAGG